MRRALVVAVLLAGFGSCSARQSADSVAWKPLSFDGSPSSNENSRYRPVVSTAGMVVSDDRLANEWGAEVLRRGGNAVDAAVATAFMLAVTRPGFAALGGGGFIVYCPKDGGGCAALDYREKAPSAATRDMYIREGKARTDLSQVGALAVGVPGTPAGLVLALEKWGRLPLRMILEEPIRTARKGIRVTGWLEYAIDERWKDMNDEARRVFGCRGKPCPAGAVLKQEDHARVLEELVRKGARGFYEGEVARKIVRAVRAAGGILTEEDLRSYRPEIRIPVSGTYKGYEIISMPPPSAGGAMVVQLLGYFERAEKQGALSEGFGSASAVHAQAHALALSFADRAELFGDPAFVRIPLERFLSSAYLDERWKTFDPSRAALPVKAGIEAPASGGSQTTHLSVVDREGGAVALTTTLNRLMGSAFVAPGTGVLLNDEMDDFSIQPGVPNVFGLVGSAANAIAPGKRPLSSMAPTIVRDSAKRVRLVIGAQGGPRITSSVALAIQNRFGFGLSVVDAVFAPRIHQQWKPAALRYEVPGLAPETLSRLEALGYALKPEIWDVARIHALERFESGRVWGVADPRGEGSAVAE
ncbi:MAG TPA: gamma-glutamyltransferase [Bdellovibrionota bacterium]|nr:gamma-glutamyltransferase [Bdellovibrionota bacterium]